MCANIIILLDQFATINIEDDRSYLIVDEQTYEKFSKRFGPNFRFDEKRVTLPILFLGKKKIKIHSFDTSISARMKRGEKDVLDSWTNEIEREREGVGEKKTRKIRNEFETTRRMYIRGSNGISRLEGKSCTRIK